MGNGKIVPMQLGQMNTLQQSDIVQQLQKQQNSALESKKGSQVANDGGQQLFAKSRS